MLVLRPFFQPASAHPAETRRPRLPQRLASTFASATYRPYIDLRVGDSVTVKSKMYSQHSYDSVNHVKQALYADSVFAWMQISHRDGYAFGHIILAAA